jgi:hypothetical protein
MENIVVLVEDIEEAFGIYFRAIFEQPLDFALIGLLRRPFLPEDTVFGEGSG